MPLLALMMYAAQAMSFAAALIFTAALVVQIVNFVCHAYRGREAHTSSGMSIRPGMCWGLFYFIFKSTPMVTG